MHTNEKQKSNRESPGGAGNQSMIIKKMKKKGLDEEEEEKVDERMEFMDTFWGITDDQPKKRARAAQSLLVHCFPVSPKFEEKNDGNLKDAAYALGRLFDGLNSGRANARQGFASCLSSFLRISFSIEGNMEIIQTNYRLLKSSTNPTAVKDKMNNFDFIRTELLRRTDPNVDHTSTNNGEEDQSTKMGFSSNKSKKKGGSSDERGFAFGRLFGILAVCRSGILSRAPLENVEGYVQDVYNLFQWRKWMRESCAHAIIEIFETIQSKNENREFINEDFLKKSIIPLFFSSTHDEAENQNSSLLQWTPEAIAIFIYMERKFDICINGGRKRFLACYYEKSIDDGNTKKLMEAMQSTSSATRIMSNSDSSGTRKDIIQKRHILWNEIWNLYNSPKIPLDEKEQLLSFLFENFVKNFLIADNVSTTERKSLALSLVLDYIQVTKVSKKTSTDNTKTEMLSLETLVDCVLSELMVRKLFLDVLSASSGHLLKEMANCVLNLLFDKCLQASKKSDGSGDELVYSLIKASIRTDPRFDQRTRTKFVLRLISILKQDGFRNLIEFLEERILFLSNLVSSPSTDDESKCRYIHQARGICDLYSNLCNNVKIRKEEFNDSFLNEMQNRVMIFLQCGAFFDCGKSDLNSLDGSKLSDSSKELMLLNTIQKLPTLPLPIRKILSTHFYTFSSEITMSSLSFRLQGRGTSNSLKNGNIDYKTNKTSLFFKALFEIFHSIEFLQNRNINLYTPLSSIFEDDNDVDVDVGQRFRKQVLGFCKKSQHYLSLQSNEESPKGKEEDSAGALMTGCTTLLLALFIQSLQYGSSEGSHNVNDAGFVQDMMEEQGEEEEREDVVECINDLIDAMTNVESCVQKSEENEVNEKHTNCLTLLVETFISILTRFDHYDHQNSNTRSRKLIYETVRIAWTGSLISASAGTIENNNHLIVDQDVMDLILDSVGGSNLKDDEDLENEESSDGDMLDRSAGEESMEDDMDEVEANKASAFTVDELDSMDVEVNDNETMIENVEDDDKDDDVEVSHEQLQNMLLEDASDDEMEGQLEHHEGADAALAHMIKVKQDARKKGLFEKERVELIQRQRCLMMLDVLFSTQVASNEKEHPPSPKLFKGSGVMLTCLLPLLQTRRKLEKSLIAQDDGATGKKLSLQNEKKKHLERLTMVWSNKICKFKGSGIFTAGSFNYDDVKRLSTSLFAEAKKSPSSKHCGCCSAALIFILKNISDVDGKTALIKDVYSSAIEDWSSRKNTNIHNVFFEDIITKQLELSRVVLLPSFIFAVLNGRSSFMKCEALKMLSALYHVKDSSTSSKMNELVNSDEKKEILVLTMHTAEALSSINSLFDDEEIKKTKRLRDVVVASNDIIVFGINYCLKKAYLLENKKEKNQIARALNSIGKKLEVFVDDKGHSNVAINMCSKLIETIAEVDNICIDEAEALIEPKEEVIKIAGNKKDDASGNEQHSSKKKKDKKKKSKKKR